MLKLYIWKAISYLTQAFKRILSSVPKNPLLRTSAKNNLKSVFQVESILPENSLESVKFFPFPITNTIQVIILRKTKQNKNYCSSLLTFVPVFILFPI